MLTAAGGPLVVTALHATAAYDYEYYRSRLTDPAILVDAVAICVFRAPLLAVPVAGARRGGYMSFDLLSLATAAKTLLDGRPGFPDLRVRWSPYRDTCHVLEWGEHPPDDDAERGRFYGYSAEAISNFLLSRASATPASALPPRSPAAVQPPKRVPAQHSASERTSTMCRHHPPCPAAEAPDREAAKVVTTAFSQGWTALCNGVVVFEDTGELLPDGRVIEPHRPAA